ncbi:hypothetical protein TPA0905_28650 [Streptomyces olivaceus]|nr:hypothetical protein TPA0905_28650 [Streptomyces olivaceus]
MREVQLRPAARAVMPVAVAVTVTAEPAAKCQTPPSVSYTMYCSASPASARRVAVAAGSGLGPWVLARASGGTARAHACQVAGRDPGRADPALVVPALVVPGLVVPGLIVPGLIVSCLSSSAGRGGSLVPGGAS